MGVKLPWLAIMTELDMNVASLCVDVNVGVGVLYLYFLSSSLDNRTF